MNPVYTFKDTIDQVIYRVHARSYSRAYVIMDKYLDGGFVHQPNIEEYTRPGSNYTVQDVTHLDIK